MDQIPKNDGKSNLNAFQTGTAPQFLKVVTFLWKSAAYFYVEAHAMPDE